MFEQVGAEAPPSRLRAIGQALPRVGLALFCLFVGYTKFDSDPRGADVSLIEVGGWCRVVQSTFALRATAGQPSLACPAEAGEASEGWCGRKDSNLHGLAPTSS